MASNIQELYQELAKLVEEMKDFLDANEEKDGSLSTENMLIYNRMETRLENLRNKIDRKKKIEEADAQTRIPVGKPILPNPQNSFDCNIGRASKAYKDAAIEAIRSKFKVIRNDLATSPDTSGGYLIPAEWDTRLIEKLESENIIRQLGTSITTSGEHKINIVATKPAASWTAEGQPMTFGNGAFKQIALDAHKVSIGILITEELLADNAFNLENYIIEQFGKGIANAEEEAFITGDGEGKPTGILTTIAADETSYITTAGNLPTADEMLDLVYKLERPYRANAAFLVNDATLATIRKFKDATSNYLWRPSYAQGEPDRLLGFPIYSTPYMPTIASGTFPVLFGDFSYYNIADRGNRSFQELRELYVTSGLVGFIMKERVDGILVDKSAIRALKIK